MVAAKPWDLGDRVAFRIALRRAVRGGANGRAYIEEFSAPFSAREMARFDDGVFDERKVALRRKKKRERKLIIEWLHERLLARPEMGGGLRRFGTWDEFLAWLKEHWVEIVRLVLSILLVVI